ALAAHRDALEAVATVLAPPQLAGHGQARLRLPGGHGATSFPLAAAAFRSSLALAHQRQWDFMLAISLSKRFASSSGGHGALRVSETSCLSREASSEHVPTPYPSRWKSITLMTSPSSSGEQRTATAGAISTYSSPAAYSPT